MASENKVKRWKAARESVLSAEQLFMGDGSFGEWSVGFTLLQFLLQPMKSFHLVAF